MCTPFTQFSGPRNAILRYTESLFGHRARGLETRKYGLCWCLRVYLNHSLRNTRKPLWHACLTCQTTTWMKIIPVAWVKHCTASSSNSLVVDVRQTQTWK